MAGHSKWANIRFRKGAQDAKRGKLFTKLIREITVAARDGGGDPTANPRLRAAIDKARGQSMPKDNIDRAIKRGTGDAEGMSYEEVRYEGYGPGGIAVMVDCLTDNRNRTVAEVRHAFSKFGGNLGADGSVAYLFEQTGLLSYTSGQDPDALMEGAIEAGADDVVANDDGSADVICEACGVRCRQGCDDGAGPWRPITLRSPCMPVSRRRCGRGRRRACSSSWTRWTNWTMCNTCIPTGISPPSCSRRLHDRSGPHPRHRPGFTADRLRHHRRSRHRP